MNLDDPAGRLLSVLSKGSAYPQNMPCRQVWVELLGGVPSEEVLLSKLGKLMQLPSEIVELLGRHYGLTEQDWAHWSSQVTRAFLSQNIDSHWGSFASHIDHHTLNYLRMQSSLLKQRVGREILEEDRLKELRAQFSDLVDQVLVANIDARIKQELVSRLKAVINSVDDYQITGSIGLSRSIDAAIGATADSGLGRVLTDSEIGKRVFDCLSAAANLVTVTVGVPQLTFASASVIAAVS